jgi:hypothetical protein
MTMATTTIFERINKTGTVFFAATLVAASLVATHDARAVPT